MKRTVLKRVTIMDVILAANTPPKVNQIRIARKMGLSDNSRAYLSRVFNGHVKVSTRQCRRILKVIKELKEEKTK